MNLYQKLFVGFFLTVTLLSAATISILLIISNNGTSITGTPIADKISITLYSSPTCGCCHKYVEYLENLNISVIFNKTEAYLEIKDQYNVPEELRSCHTMVIIDNESNEYIVEGHVPIKAIERLFNEKPYFNGISLPGMPNGAPGIAGDQEETFEIIAFDDGEIIGIWMRFEP